MILSPPKRYLSRVFLPSFLSYLCKLGVIAIFLGAFAIPVTFESIMWVVGSGSLANVASFTPGAVGVTQATNALALKTCCDVANDVAIDYSTAQQLITTAWNEVLAIVLSARSSAGPAASSSSATSYVDAKTKVAETKEERRSGKKEAKRAARKSSARPKKPWPARPRPAGAGWRPTFHVAAASSPTTSVGHDGQEAVDQRRRDRLGVGRPKATRAPVSPSSTKPTPPGVIGIEPRIRASAQAANASTIVTSARGMPTARSEASRTRKTVRCPASVAAVRKSQRRRISSIDSSRKRTKTSPVPLHRRLADETLGPARRAGRPGRRCGARAARWRGRWRSPRRSRRRRRARSRRRARACGCCPPCGGERRRRARIGKPRITNWFQTLCTTTASPTGGPRSPTREHRERVAIPTAAPPGATDDSAVDASVTRVARRYESPGARRPAEARTSRG